MDLNRVLRRGASVWCGGCRLRAGELLGFPGVLFGGWEGEKERDTYTKLAHTIPFPQYLLADF